MHRAPPIPRLLSRRGLLRAMAGVATAAATTSILPGPTLAAPGVEQPAARAGAQAGPTAASGSTLPRNVVLTLGEVKQVLPEMSQETATGEDESALGNPRGSRSVTYATDDGSRRVVISVALYQSIQDASSAYLAAVQGSLAAPGGAGEALSNLGEQAFIGVSAQGDETHVGAGALYGDLIVNVTLQGYDGTTENRARVTELIRMEAAAATRAL
jgi:hypothetical protein